MAFDSRDRAERLPSALPRSRAIAQPGNGGGSFPPVPGAARSLQSNDLAASGRDLHEIRDPSKSKAPRKEAPVGEDVTPTSPLRSDIAILPVSGRSGFPLAKVGAER
jgi:hypothetical protein